jgi:hypothetical protein
MNLILSVLHGPPIRQSSAARHSLLNGPIKSASDSKKVVVNCCLLPVIIPKKSFLNEVANLQLLICICCNYIYVPATHKVYLIDVMV